MKPTEESSGPGSTAAPKPGRTTLTWGLLVAAALLPIALLGLYAFWITTQSVVELVQANNHSAATLTAELLARQFEQSISLARAGASFPGFVEGVKAHDEVAVRT